MPTRAEVVSELGEWLDWFSVEEKDGYLSLYAKPGDWIPDDVFKPLMEHARQIGGNYDSVHRAIRIPLEQTAPQPVTEHSADFTTADRLDGAPKSGPPPIREQPKFTPVSEMPRRPDGRVDIEAYAGLKEPDKPVEKKQETAKPETSIAPVDKPDLLATLSRAKLLLAETKDLNVILNLRDKAVAAQAWARARNADDVYLQALEIKLRAERRAGQFLADMKREGILREGRPEKRGQDVLVSPTLKSLGVEQKESQRWQQLANIPEEKFEDWIIHAKRKTQAALLQVAKELSAELESVTTKIRETPPGIRTILGDFREVGSQIESGIVDLVFTDPPYGEEGLDLWEPLGKMAARVLKDGGYLVTYAGQQYISRVLNGLAESLQYYWIGGVRHTGGEARIWDKSIWVRWKPLLIFSNGKGADHEWLNDLIEGKEGDKDAHAWAQGESEAAYFIEKLTPVDGRVLDPMMGSGTTLRAALKLKRDAIGIEKDPEVFGRVQF